MKVDSLPAAIMLIWELWKTLHTLLFGWEKGQFYPEKRMLGWHFLIRWLCSLLVWDVLMLEERGKIVLPQGFNCLYLAVSDPFHASLSSKLIHYHSLHDSSDLHLSPQEKCSGSEQLGNSRELCPARQLPPAASSPQGLAGLSLLCTVTRMSDCPHTCQGQPGQGKAAVLPWEVENVTLCTLTYHLDKVTSWGWIKVISCWFSVCT